MGRGLDTKLLVVALHVVDKVRVGVELLSKMDGFEGDREAEAQFGSAVIQIHTLWTADGLRGSLAALDAGELLRQRAGDLSAHVLRKVDREGQLFLEGL